MQSNSGFSSLNEEIHDHIRRCMEGQCSFQDDKLHKFCEKIAWAIMNHDHADWRMIPAFVVSGCVQWVGRLFLRR